MRFILAIVTVLATTILPVAAEDVATVGGTAISRETLEKHVKAKLIEIDNERYEALKEGLDELVGEELLTQEAKARNVTPDALVKEEIIGKIAAPTDAEVAEVYEANKAQLGGQTLEQVKPRIVAFLSQQKAGERRLQYLEELKKKYATTIKLKAPVVQVGTGGRPEMGPKDAPITMIVFSDYECPYCRKAEETVEQVLKTYQGKIRYVFRDYPLPFHQNARPAAVAAACANEQGKYWEMNAKLFKGELTADGMKKMAGEIGLDAKKFADCTAKNDQKPIEKDLADGGEVGVNGTPAFFINGRMLSGAQPFEAFKAIIDEELAAAPKKS